MQPQGSGVVNTAYFTQLTNEINAIDVCGDLQSLVNAAMASLQAEISTVEAQIAALLPMISIPHDLGSVISWITGQIAPITLAYNNYLTQLTQLMSAISALETAIANAEARIMNCSITIPMPHL